MTNSNAPFRARTLLPTLLLVGTACGASTPRADAAADAAAPVARAVNSDAPPAADAVAPVEGIADPPKLAALSQPGGVEAPDNAPADVAAALTARDCRLDQDGALQPDCPATAAYLAARNNFVVAKADAHLRTALNLLSAPSPQVRLLVLKSRPVDYIEMYGGELATQWSTYEPVVAAALAEKDSHVRSAFAWVVKEIPSFAEQPQTVPYVGALGELYAKAEDGHLFVDLLGELWDQDCPACKDGLFGIAARNPDPRMRQRALAALSDREVDARVFCPLSLGQLDVDPATIDPDEGEVSEFQDAAVRLFTNGAPDCSGHYEAWFAQIEAKTEASTVPLAWVAGLTGVLSQQDGEQYTARIVALAKRLRSSAPEQSELADALDQLAEWDAS